MLREMDLIVELHDLLRPGVSQQVTERFSGTHEIQIVPSHGSVISTAWPELDTPWNLWTRCWRSGNSARDTVGLDAGEGVSTSQLKAGFFILPPAVAAGGAA